MIEKEETRDYYNGYFKQPPDTFGENFHILYYRRLFKIASRKKIILNKQQSLLEIGPGYSSFYKECIKRGISYQAIERNKLNAEKLNNLQIKITCASVPPFPDGEKVDIIWMAHVVEHLPDYISVRKLLVDAKKRLNKYGKVVIISPDILSWGNYFWLDWTHNYPTSLDRIEQVLQEAGYKVIHSFHHTATFTNPFVVFFLTNLFRIIPVNFLDTIFKKIFKRRFVRSYAVLFGWRQIFVVGELNE